MASETAIEAAIQRIVSTYFIWTIGVTDDPKRGKAEHGDPKYWHAWDADTEADARNVEKHFIKKGMKGGTGGNGHANYVYIY